MLNNLNGKQFVNFILAKPGCVQDGNFFLQFFRPAFEVIDIFLHRLDISTHALIAVFQGFKNLGMLSLPGLKYSNIFLQTGYIGFQYCYIGFYFCYTIINFSNFT